MRKTEAKIVVLFLALAACLTLAIWGEEALSLRASTLGGCKPAPAVFRVPEGMAATRFQIERLAPGKPCGPEGGSTQGFSIRRGSATVFVYYYDEAGRAVSDPCPLSALVLEEGSYALYAAPASGADAVIRYTLDPAPR